MEGGSRIEYVNSEVPSVAPSCLDLNGTNSILLICSKDGDGDDVDKTFQDSVVVALQKKGYSTFKYDQNIESEEALKQIVQQAKCCVVIFSKNYVSSRRCLDELVTIANHFSTSPHRILPVYYYVDKSDVRHQLGSLSVYENVTDDEMTRRPRYDIKRCRAAFKQVADHSPGLNFPNVSSLNGGEAEDYLITKIVLEVGHIVRHVGPKHLQQLVGIERRSKSLRSWVDKRNG